MDKPSDVIIAGAGPVGLFLASELAAAGVSVLVLERDAQPDSPWKKGVLGRRGLHRRAVEALYRRGLLDKVFDTTRPIMFEKTEGFQFGGHFAGIMLNANDIDFSRFEYQLQGPTFNGGATTLDQMQTALLERAQALGVQILTGMQVSQVKDEGESVKVWAGDQCFEAKWLVGCDGGRSTVRREANFTFEGTEPEFIGYVVQCEVENQELLAKGFCHTDNGMYINAGAGNLYATDFDTSFDRSQPVTREHFQTVIRRVTGLDISVKSLDLATTFTDRAKIVTEYRKGRILLAGDSAHIHSPLGAQGMNTGIGDAINLGWKLAATIKGHASPGLLDTYHSERYPDGQWVLEWTRSQVATLRPDPYGKAISKIIRSMISTTDGATYFAKHIWGISRRYDLGDAHSLVGCSAPDFEFDDGQRLGSKLEKGNFLVVDFSGSESVAQLMKSWEPVVGYSGSNAKETFGFKALLIRPDGIVAWLSTDDLDVDALKKALSRWVNLPEA
jgi:2-polyprenyl-6-methoxyphenol hydroxylase-like FAD-dependent oxidoreductase